MFYFINLLISENDNSVISAVKRICVRNKVAAIVSVEHALDFSDNGRNVPESFDDEYEHPYNILIADQRSRDNHTYVTIKAN